MTELIQDNDTGAWDIEHGAKLYSGSYENHFIDGELVEVFVFYYEVIGVTSWFEESEIHTSVDLAVLAPEQEVIKTLTLDFEDIEQAINDGSLKPTDLSYSDLLTRERIL